jgi:hypothetical protein
MLQAVGAKLVRIGSQAENQFVRYNMLWPGFFGESYTGLSKQGNVWAWEDGTNLTVGHTLACTYHAAAHAPNMQLPMHLPRSCPCTYHAAARAPTMQMPMHLPTMQLHMHLPCELSNVWEWEDGANLTR